MCNACKSIDRRFAEGAVDEEAVVVADEGESDYADCFEDAGADDEVATKLALRFGGYTEGLRNYGHYDDSHTDQCQAAGFGKLHTVSLIMNVDNGAYLRYIPI